MTDRERFVALLDYQQLDAPLLMQWMGFSETVLARWHREGLPEEGDPGDYFGLARRRTVPVTVFAYPPREEVELSREGTRRVVLDNRDLHVLHDSAAPHLPQYVGHPVASRADWRRYHARLNTEEGGRYDALRASAEALRASTDPVILGLRGCWEIRYFCGMTEVLMLLHDDPGFVEEMLAEWFAHQWRIIDRVCEYITPDAVCIWEDLAYKNGPFVSPEMYRRFFSRYHAETARRLRGHGVRHFLVDCDGDIDALLPLFLENGLTGTYPLECQAGSDPIKHRRRFGQTVQLVGGIDKRALIEGPEATRREVEHKLPHLVADRGYLPSLDHVVPPEVPLDTFRRYVDDVREVWSRLL